MPSLARSFEGRGASIRRHMEPAVAIERPDFLRMALALLIVMVTSRSHQIIPWIAAMRPLLLAAAGAAIYAYLNPRVLVKGNVLRHWWTRLIVVVAVQAGLSGIFGISIGNSGKFIIYAYSTVLLLAGLLIVSARSTADLMTFVSALMIGAGALAWQAVFMFRLTHGPGLARLDSQYTFDANDVGLMLVVALPLAVSLVTVWSGWKRFALISLLAGIGIGIARTGSRGAFLALLAVGVLIVVFSRGASTVKRLSLAAAVVAALVISAPAGYFKQMETSFHPKSDYNWTDPVGRRAVFHRGIGYMLRYPVFGVGINNFQKAECTISERFEKEPMNVGIKCMPPHNTWIQAGAELGMPGLIAWVALLLVPLQKLVRLRREVPVSWRRGDIEQRFLFACTDALPIAIVGFMVASTFLTFAWLDIPYLLVIFSGLTWQFVRTRLAGQAFVIPRLEEASRTRAWRGA